MGNKIITEKDFFECSGGMMPSPFQARQPIVKRQDGAKYITKDDISTVSWVDFGCKKVMLLYAVVAAVAVAVAALCVATGGAALIAMCAIAGAAGAILGAIVGTLICGQLVAPTRKWIGSKSNFKIQGINTISGDHYIQCDAFTYLGMSPEFVRFNPQIKTWSQAIAKGGAAFIGNVFEGMMAGAAIGGIAAGGAALFGSGSWAGAGNVTLQFLKSIPKNIAGNIIESYMLPGLGIRGVMTAQNVAAGYGETGEFSASQAMSDAKDGFFGMELGTVDSFKNISTGNGTWQDYTGLALNLMPVGKGTRDLLDGKKKSGSAKTEGEAPSKMDETDTTKPKVKTEGDAPTKKVEGDAYETGGINNNKKYFDGVEATTDKTVRAQTHPSSCAPTSLDMVLRDMGEMHPTYDIEGALKWDENGAFVRDIPEALKDLGMENKADYSANRSISEIDAATKNGDGVIASVDNGQGAHAVVIDRVEDGRVVIRDPLPIDQGSVYSISIEDFEVAHKGSVIIEK